MPSIGWTCRFQCLFAILVIFVICSTLVTAKQDVKSVSRMSASELEDALQLCPIVQDLNRHKLLIAPQTSSLASRTFAVLFPGGPAVNALLATLYISGPPNFLLALCPPNIDPASLSVMVAFAVGGLLGDTLFHLLPEIFLGEEFAGQARFVLVEPNKNILLGVAILVGFLTFVTMDKALRIATAGSGSHDHSHGQTPKLTAIAIGKAKTTGTSPSSHEHGLRSRKGIADAKIIAGKISAPETVPEVSPSIRLSAYLNLIADFTHNITDGLALSSSFYASPTLGATTTVAVFFHEIPHEVGDFALLVQSGFSKKKAMGAQFVTAAGAFLGTCIGIAVQEFGKAPSHESDIGGVKYAGLVGTGLGYGDLLLPFTAGTFLYVGTVAVIPELLETGENRREELWKTAQQFMAMAFGAGIMLAISWS